jgi:hypothetical protein
MVSRINAKLCMVSPDGDKLSNFRSFYFKKIQVRTC